MSNCAPTVSSAKATTEIVMQPRKMVTLTKRNSNTPKERPMSPGTLRRLQLAERYYTDHPVNRASIYQKIPSHLPSSRLEESSIRVLMKTCVSYSLQVLESGAILVLVVAASIAANLLKLVNLIWKLSIGVWELVQNLYKRILPKLQSRKQSLNSLLRFCGSNKFITLVLDLDETLVHASEKRPIDDRLSYLTVTVADGRTLYVTKRPYLEEFLSAMAPYFNLVVFTASTRQYADIVIDWLEEDIVFEKRLYRESCTKLSSGYTKDLRIVTQDLKRVVIVDNSPTAYQMNPENAIPIKSWYSTPEDSSLVELMQFLLNICVKTDVKSFDIRKELKESRKV